jgi:large subunit ribosomal protein L35
MPKMKSHSGASKRFRLTGTGKVVRRKAGRRHLLTSKNRDRKRRLKEHPVVEPNAARTIRSLIPYQ